MTMTRSTGGSERKSYFELVLPMRSCFAGAIFFGCLFLLHGNMGSAFASAPSRRISSERLHDAVTHDYDDMSYDDYYDPDRMDRSDPEWDDDEWDERESEE